MKNEFRRLQRLPAPPVVFDEARAYRMLEQVFGRINEFWRPGALLWSRMEATDLFARQQSAGEAVDVAFAAEDMGQIKAALAEFGRAMRALCVRFDEAEAAGIVGSSPCAQKCTMSIRHDFNFNILDLDSQKVDAEHASDRAGMNHPASSSSERRSSGPTNSQQHHVQGFALNKNPSSAGKKNRTSRANGSEAPWF